MSYAKFTLPLLALIFATISIAALPAQADGPGDDAQPRHEFSLTARWSETAGAALLSWKPLPGAHSYWIHLTDNTENGRRWLPAVRPDAGKERYIHRIDSLNEAADYTFQVIARRKNAAHYRDNWSNPSELIRLPSRAAPLSATLQTSEPRTKPMPVCDRTPKVVAELIRQTGKSRCSEVTTGDLSQVTLVDLHKKEVTALKPGDFDNLPNLTQLWLHENQISELHPDTFQNLPNLYNLYLGHNQLTAIEPGTFRNLPRLNRLWIQDNPLASINPNLFNDLAKLRYLILCGNRLTALEPGTFANLTGLRVLDLCQNPGLTKLPPGLFPAQADLRILDLRDNGIDEIHPNVLADLPSLHTLQTSGNPLTTLDHRWFDHLPKLNSIDIDENLLSNLHPFAKERLNRLDDIDIYSSLENLDENIDRARKLNARSKFVYISRETIWNHQEGTSTIERKSPTRNSLIGIP